MPRFPMLLLSAALLAAGAHAAPSVYPTGVTRYDPQKAFNQYVIFSGADRKTHLIDMNGNEVKRWDYPGFPAAVIDPALNGGKRGHVLLQLADLAAPDKLASPGNGLANQALGELDWDGKEVWRWGDRGAGRRRPSAPRPAPAGQRQHPAAGEQGPRGEGLRRAPGNR